MTQLQDLLRTDTRDHDHDLHLRVRGEFVEMPGLRLTLAQAARLFHLEAARCERVLAALVESGVLSVSGRMFVRTESGPRLRASN